MARILLNSPHAVAPGLSVSATLPSSAPSSHGLTAEALDARLRQKRSAAYIETLSRLDAGTHLHDVAALDALLAAIRQELPEVSIEELPSGIVARCYLGAPYEVHTLDRVGGIIQHYKNWEAMPPVLEPARALALHAGYAFVEVYTSKLIAVSRSGETSVVER